MKMRRYHPANNQTNDGISGNPGEENIRRTPPDIFISENSEAHPETERNQHSRRKTSSVYREEDKSSQFLDGHNISYDQCNVSIVYFSKIILSLLGMGTQKKNCK
jgi:hypothetical protein